MRRKFLLPAILFAGLIFVSFSFSQVYGQVPQEKTVKLKTKKYTCPMHPEVVQDKPGNCPKCNGMLVEKTDIPIGVKKMAKDTTMIKKAQKTIDTTSIKREPVK